MREHQSSPTFAMRSDDHLHFGTFGLDLANERLWRQGQLVPLRPKVFALLRYLVDNPSRLVSQEELTQALWGHPYQSDGLLRGYVRELRRALGDDASAPRYLETASGKGYRFLAPVSAQQTSAPEVVATGPKSEPELLSGREKQLEQLHALFQRANDGRRQVVWISGEAGVGKTALLDQFVAQLETRADASIGTGQCIEHHGEGEPYMPMLDALSRLSRKRDGDGLVAVLRRHATTWLAQLPALVDDDERALLAVHSRGATEQRMARELAEALEVLAAQRPLLLCLEDLHWSDPSTLSLLQMISRRTVPARLMVIGVFRPAETTARSHPLRLLVNKLRNQSNCAEIALEPLTPAQVTRYLALRFDAEETLDALQTWGRSLHQRTGGIPLFLAAIVDDLVARGELGAAVVRSPPRDQRLLADLPDSLRQLLANQIERLGVEQEKMLGAGSAAGMTFSAGLVAALVGAMADDVEACCERAAAARLFLQVPPPWQGPERRATERFAFRHALYRDALYGRLAPSERRRLHRRIADWKRAAYGARGPAISAELASHYEHARHHADAVHFHGQAAQQALQRAAHQEAIDHLKRAVTLLSSLPQTPEHDARELGLLAKLGPLLLQTQGYASREARDAFERASVLSGKVGSAQEADAVTPSSSAPAGNRRHAAVLFAGMSGFDEQCATYDPEQVQAMLVSFVQAMGEVVRYCGGTVIDRAGGGVLAVFGAPTAHGNDPRRAIRAAFDMHDAAHRLKDCAGHALRLQIGGASGEVVVTESVESAATTKHSFTGGPMNLATTLAALAGPDETLISDALYQALLEVLEAADRGERSVKGLQMPVHVWEAVALRPMRFKRSSFVGREIELQQFVGALHAVRETRRGCAFLVQGNAGIGKTRLVEEVLARAQAHGFETALGQVLDFGAGKDREAVPTILSEVLGVPAGDGDARRAAIERALETGSISTDEKLFVEELLNVDHAPALQAVFDAMDDATRRRRSCETFAAVLERSACRQPLLIVFEDTHWASPSVLRHLSALAAVANHCPMLLLLTSRTLLPGLLPDAAEPLAEVALQPFSDQESQRLADQTQGGSERFTAMCIQRAEGNPLFLEQLLRSAHAGDERGVPPTVQSLVLARVDQMSRRDRTALQSAAVLGQRFTLQGLRAVADDAGYSIEPLLAAEMVRMTATDDYLFAHALIQEAIYSSTLNTMRRRLHRRCADWFGDTEPVLRAEHFDRAESPEAAQAYLTATRSEAQRFRFDSALRLAARAAELAADRATSCAAALLQGELLRETGQSAASIVAFRRAIDLAQHDSDRCRALTGIAAGQRVTGELDLAMEALSQAQSIAESGRLYAERSRIHHMRGNLHFARGDTPACEAEHRQALEFARLADDPECEVHALGGMADASYAQGRIAMALSFFRRCVQCGSDRGWLGVETSNRCMTAICLWLQGDLPAGIAELERACLDARRIGAVPVQLLAMDTLAILLLEAGRFEEAERFCVEGLSLARPAGSRRYESLLLWNLAACALAKGEGAGDSARRYLDESLRLARETGLGSMGPAIYARLALATAGAQDRAEALREGERLLAGPCLAHACLMFYRDAIEASIDTGDWKASERYVHKLEQYVHEEPLPWTRLIVSRARALRKAVLAPQHHGVREELMQVRKEVAAAGWNSALPRVDAALAAV